jgi:hypothetical protein
MAVRCLLDICENCNRLTYTSIQSIPDILSGWCLSMQTMEELGHFQLPWIVYRSLRHGAMYYHAETWGDGGGWMARQWASGSRHGVSAFKLSSIKMQLCLLSSACLYHKPTTIIGHSFYNVDISKLLAHTP